MYVTVQWFDYPITIYSYIAIGVVYMGFSLINNILYICGKQKPLISHICKQHLAIYIHTQHVQVHKYVG